MERRRALMFVALLLAPAALAGCTGLDPDEMPVEQVPEDSPPCARLTLESSSSTLAIGEIVTFVARLENCGSVPLDVPDGFCGGWTRLGAEGPVGGRAGAGSVATGFASCGPVVLHPQSLKVKPAMIVERAYWWNGTMTGACTVQLGEQINFSKSGCPWPQPAPAGQYHFSVYVPLPEHEGMQEAATANVSVDLRPWNVTRGPGAELSPSWDFGPATLMWRNTTGEPLALTVPASTLFSTDGASYLYVVERHALGGGWPADCETTRPQGAWVLVDRSACLYVAHPGVWCAEPVAALCSTVASEGAPAS